MKLKLWSRPKKTGTCIFCHITQPYKVKHYLSGDIMKAAMTVHLAPLSTFHFINTGSSAFARLGPVSPAARTQRTHSSQNGHQEETGGGWQTHLRNFSTTLGSQACVEDPNIVPGPCVWLQSACGDQIKVSEFWHDERWANEAIVGRIRAFFFLQKPGGSFTGSLCTLVMD